MSFPRYPNYKASGVDWLGDVPEHWKIDSVRGMVQERNEKNVEGRYQNYLSLMANVGVLPYEEKGDVGNKKPEDLSKCKIVRREDLVINSMNYGIGSYGISHFEGVCSPVYVVLVPKTDKVLVPFAYRVFENRAFQIYAQSFGNGILEHRCAIGWDILKSLHICLPPIPEQRVISSFLDSETSKIDALIAEQERLIELLKEKRQAVISHGVTKGVNEGAVKKHSGVQWIGEIPQKWTVCEVRRVVNQIEQGWSPECLGRHAELSEWGVLKTGCVNYGRFAEQENKALPDDLTPATEYEVRPGDVIMSRANGSPELVGSTAIVESVRPRLMLSDKLFRFGFGKDLDPRFFVLIFNARYMRAQIERAISGAEGLANNLPQSALKSFVLALPPMAEQGEIVKRISAKLQEIDRLGGEAATYIALAQERRSALITAAVTGQIDVRGLAEQKTA